MLVFNKLFHTHLDIESTHKITNNFNQIKYIRTYYYLSRFRHTESNIHKHTFNKTETLNETTIKPQSHWHQKQPFFQTPKVGNAQSVSTFRRCTFFPFTKLHRTKGTAQNRRDFAPVDEKVSSPEAKYPNYTYYVYRRTSTHTTLWMLGGRSENPAPGAKPPPRRGAVTSNGAPERRWPGLRKEERRQGGWGLEDTEWPVADVKTLSLCRSVVSTFRAWGTLIESDRWLLGESLDAAGAGLDRFWDSVVIKDGFGSVLI